MNAVEAPNRFGKLSELRIATEFRDGKTIMAERFFTAPFKIMLPLYEWKFEGTEVMQMLQLMASPGIMAGDTQSFSFDIREGSVCEYCTQAYEKVHKMNGGVGNRKVTVNMEKDTFFYFHPKPIIPFKDSAVQNDINITLADDTSKFIYEEILCCGRVAFGESFDYRFFNNSVNVFKAGKLIFRDNVQFRPDEFDMTGDGMYEGYTHLANQIFFNVEKSDQWVAEVLDMLKKEPEMDGGITRLATGDVVVRFFGMSGDPMEKMLTKIVHLKDEF